MDDQQPQQNYAPVQNYQQPAPGAYPPPQGMYPPPHPKKAGKGVSIAALILGIFSLVLALIIVSSPIALPLSIAGLIVSIVANKKTHSGMAVTGLALSCIALGFTLLLGPIVCTVCSAVGSLGEMMSSAPLDDILGDLLWELM